MKKYDISQKINFKTGTYELNSDANFNYQLNRVIMWDGGDADEVSAVSHSIRTSSDWVNAMEKLAEKAHAEGRTENEIAYLRMSEFFIYDTDPKKKQRYEEARELFYEFYSDYFDKGIVKRYEVPYEGGYLPKLSPKQAADLGCGAGRNAGELLKKYPAAKVTAMDYSALSVQKAKEYNQAMIDAGRCRVIQGDVSKLPLEKNSFELVTAFETIYFWPGLKNASHRSQVS